MKIYYLLVVHHVETGLGLPSYSCMVLYVKYSMLNSLK